MERYIIACDQGTTSSRAVLFDTTGAVVKLASVPLPVSFPQDGWVEQNPLEIWTSQAQALSLVLQGISAESVLALAVTNQRETVLAWDRRSGEPLTPAIVWQCRRTAPLCAELKARGLDEEIRRRTGLICDPYFSGTKILWLLRNIPGLREALRSRDAVFGTVDAWLVFKLTESGNGGRVVTEPTNASRTMLFSLETWDWDPEMLDLFEVRQENLPEILPSQGNFGVVEIQGARIPIVAVIGDQQGSLLGHGATNQGEAKCTFGTGAFLLLHLGANRCRETPLGLVETALWEEKLFALEGSVFVAGAVVQWLRDHLRLFETVTELEQLANSVENSGGVIFVPAFVGLGAPQWVPEARGALFGLTRDTSPGHIVRAALEGVAHQVADLLEDGAFSSVKELRVDGGMSVNRVFCETLADVLGVSIVVAPEVELTARGAAALAAVQRGVLESIDRVRDGFCGASREGEGVVYRPRLYENTRLARRNSWKEAVQGVIGFSGSR